MENIIRNTIKDFCIEFVNHPYLCYTEHGLHALFFNRLYSNLLEEERYFEWEGRKVCVIQKEYPTAYNLNKTKRQHWDLSIIEIPPEYIKNKTPSYDYFILNSVIEFGLNAEIKHIKEDIRRLSHPDSFVKNKFIIHLYRISEGFSGRDIKPNSARILSIPEIQDYVKETDVDIFFGIFDITKTLTPGLWVINNCSIESIT